MARTYGATTRCLRRQPCARDRVWFSIRALRRFDLPSLVATAEAGPSNALKYVHGLTRAGILRVQMPRALGRRGGNTVWLLLRDLGPIAPRLQADGRTYDPNAHVVLEGGLG